MQWPTKQPPAGDRSQLLFHLMMVNKWFLIPSSVVYAWILSNSSFFRIHVYDFTGPTIFYTVLSLVLIILLWYCHRKREKTNTLLYKRLAFLLSIISYITDTAYIIFLIAIPESGNILWAVFLPPIALALLVPNVKRGILWGIDMAVAVSVLLIIYGLTFDYSQSLSTPRYIPADIMICLASMFHLWIEIRMLRTWINSIHQETDLYANWHALWTTMIHRFPPEIFLLDHEGRILIASNAARKLLDLPEQGSLAWPEQTHSIRNALMLRFHAETELDDVIHIPDDSLPNPIKIFPTFFAHGNKRYCIALIQEENPEMPTPGILRSDRLTIAGQIAAGLAHEIGNPLGVIQSCAAYLLQKLPEDDPYREELELIKDETQRCQNLIDRLLSLASPKRDTPAVHDLRLILEHSLSLVKYQAGARVIEFNAYIFANEGQLSAVFVNLFLNALQSMEDSAEGAKLRIHLRTRGKEGIIDITDEGMGIPREDLEKIFDPFFTKKAQGTGLGLSIVHQIIRSMEGRIDVASVEGAGTTFTVYLPLYDLEAE